VIILIHQGLHSLPFWTWANWWSDHLDQSTREISLLFSNDPKGSLRCMNHRQSTQHSAPDKPVKLHWRTSDRTYDYDSKQGSMLRWWTIISTNNAWKSSGKCIKPHFGHSGLILVRQPIPLWPNKAWETVHLDQCVITGWTCTQGKPHSVNSSEEKA
jgi:hypothetical protein